MTTRLEKQMDNLQKETLEIIAARARRAAARSSRPARAKSGSYTLTADGRDEAVLAALTAEGGGRNTP